MQRPRSFFVPLFLITILDILRKARVADDGVADHLLGQRPLGKADDGFLAVFLLLVDPGQHVEQRSRRAADLMTAETLLWLIE